MKLDAEEINSIIKSERGELGDSLVTVVLIILAAVLMLIFPLMSTAEKTDDVAQLSVQSATDDFVDTIRTTGKITLDDYEKYLQTITATGNSFEPEILIQQLDENPGVKVTQAEMTKIGENVYYNKYTTQVMEELKSSGKMTLKEGDRVTVTVKNTNQTISQILRNFLYKVTGNESAQITAKANGIVTVNASN